MRKFYDQNSRYSMSIVMRLRFSKTERKPSVAHIDSASKVTVKTEKELLKENTKIDAVSYIRNVPHRVK